MIGINLGLTFTKVSHVEKNHSNRTKYRITWFILVNECKITTSSKNESVKALIAIAPEHLNLLVVYYQ